MTKVYLLFEDDETFFVGAFSSREKAQAEILDRLRDEAQHDAYLTICGENIEKWYDEYRAIEPEPICEIERPIIKPYEIHTEYNARMKKWRAAYGNSYMQKAFDWSKRASEFVQKKRNAIKVTEEQITEALKKLKPDDYLIKEVEVK